MTASKTILLEDVECPHGFVALSLRTLRTSLCGPTMRSVGICNFHIQENADSLKTWDAHAHLQRAHVRCYMLLLRASRLHREGKSRQHGPCQLQRLQGSFLKQCKQHSRPHIFCTCLVFPGFAMFWVAGRAER